MLRLAIPVTIVLILGATMLVSWLDPLKVLVRLPIDSGKIVISGTKITMEAPKLSGYTRDQRWYEMNAKAAAQDVTKPDVVELAEVRAKIETADKSTIFLSAKDGLFNRKTSILKLNRNVIVRSTTGFEMHLDEAVIDTANGEVVSNKPVAVFTADSTLNADRLEVEKSGEIVHFIGSVVMNIDNLNKPQQPRRRRSPRRRNDEREADQRGIRRGVAGRRDLVRGGAIPFQHDQQAARAATESGTSVPNALQGFQQNRGQPVQIEASRLEVRDKDKVATFSGNVKVVQGDTTMHCKMLVVFYEQKDEAQGTPAGRNLARR